MYSCYQWDKICPLNCCQWDKCHLVISEINDLLLSVRQISSYYQLDKYLPVISVISETNILLSVRQISSCYQWDKYPPIISETNIFLLSVRQISSCYQWYKYLTVISDTNIFLLSVTNQEVRHDNKSIAQIKNGINCYKLFLHDLVKKNLIRYNKSTTDSQPLKCNFYYNENIFFSQNDNFN